VDLPQKMWCWFLAGLIAFAIGLCPANAQDNPGWSRDALVVTSARVDAATGTPSGMAGYIFRER